MLVDARAGRGAASSAPLRAQEPRLELPRPEGRLAAEGVVYRLPGSTRPFCRAWRSASLRANRSPSSGPAAPASRRSRASSRDLDAEPPAPCASTALTYRCGRASIWALPRLCAAGCRALRRHRGRQHRAAGQGGFRAGRRRGEARQRPRHDPRPRRATTRRSARRACLSAGAAPARGARARDVWRPAPARPGRAQLQPRRRGRRGPRPGARRRAQAGRDRGGDHPPPSPIAHVDKILVLAAGRVQQFGPATQVMKTLQQQAQAMVADKAA